MAAHAGSGADGEGGAGEPHIAPPLTAIFCARTQLGSAHAEGVPPCGLEPSWRRELASVVELNHPFRTVQDADHVRGSAGPIVGEPRRATWLDVGRASGGHSPAKSSGRRDRDGRS